MQHDRHIGQNGPTTPALILSKPSQANPRRNRAGNGLTASERSAKQQREKRAQRYTTAAQVSARMGYPLTYQLTLTWNALQHGERRDGHCLHLPEPDAVTRLWRNLKHLTKSNGLPFIAMRAPEYDARRGSHIHVALYLPERLTPALIRVIENLTGAPDDTTTVFTIAEINRGYLARSACHGWLLQGNRRVGTGGELGLTKYLTKSAQRRENASRYYLSGDLSRLVAANAPTGAPERAQRGDVALAGMSWPKQRIAL